MGSSLGQGEVIEASPPIFPTYDMDLSDNNQELALVAYRGFHENCIWGMMDLQVMIESFSNSQSHEHIKEFEGKSGVFRIVEPCSVGDEHMELMDVEQVLVEWAMYEKLQWNSAGCDQDA